MLPHTPTQLYFVLFLSDLKSTILKLAAIIAHEKGSNSYYVKDHDKHLFIVDKFKRGKEKSLIVWRAITIERAIQKVSKEMTTKMKQNTHRVLILQGAIEKSPFDTPKLFCILGAPILFSLTVWAVCKLRFQDIKPI